MHSFYGWIIFHCVYVPQLPYPIICQWTSRLLTCPVCVNLSVMSNSLWPHGLWPARLFCPWDSPGKNTRVGCHSLLQRSSWPRDQAHVSRIAAIFFIIWATREAQRLFKHIYIYMFKKRAFTKSGPWTWSLLLILPVPFLTWYYWENCISVFLFLVCVFMNGTIRDYVSGSF